MNIIKPQNVQGIINKFCYTIGIIPTSYKMSMTYEEQIIAIGKYLEENVYPAINNNAQALAELQGLFVELKDYVDNYFDDLNVQTQIDNKLDTMVQDGTMAEIINQEIFGQINNDITDIKGDITDINTQIGSIDNDLDTAEGNIETLQTNLSSAQEDISDLETSVTDTNKNIIYNSISQFDTCRGIAHRGLSADAPENTLPAIKKAGLYNCFGIEIDAQVTSDGQIVLMHDLTVDRTTNGTGNVNGLTYSYINSLTIDGGNNISYYGGLKVPTIAQALEIAKKYNLHAMIELKGTWIQNNIQNLLDIIDSYNMLNNSSIISFNSSYLDMVRTINKYIPVALIYGSAVNTDLIDYAINTR